MTAEKATMAFGWRVYGLGVMALGITTLVFGTWDPGQPVPASFPARTALAYAAGALMVAAASTAKPRTLGISLLSKTIHSNWRAADSL